MSQPASAPNGELPEPLKVVYIHLRNRRLLARLGPDRIFFEVAAFSDDFGCLIHKKEVLYWTDIAEVEEPRHTLHHDA